MTVDWGKALARRREDELADAVLDFLRASDARVGQKLDTLASNMLEAKQRIGLLEQTCASISRRTDMMDERLDRIEHRLELRETA